MLVIRADWVILERLPQGCPRGTSPPILRRGSAARGCPGSNLLIYLSLVLWGTVRGGEGGRGELPASPTSSGSPSPGRKGQAIQTHSGLGQALPGQVHSQPALSKYAFRLLPRIPPGIL